MRPFPAPSEYGSWDSLPDFPAPAELNLADPAVKDGMQRRDQLVAEWRGYLDYPQGVWPQKNIELNPSQAEAWRNWLLRRAWEGVQFINGNLRRWSSAA